MSRFGLPSFLEHLLQNGVNRNRLPIEAEATVAPPDWRGELGGANLSAHTQLPQVSSESGAGQGHNSSSRHGHNSSCVNALLAWYTSILLAPVSTSTTTLHTESAGPEIVRFGETELRIELHSDAVFI